MKKLLVPAIAALALMASCGSPATETVGRDDESDGPVLADETDSLSYYLGLGLAERLRDRISSDSLLSAEGYDPEKLNEGLRAILSVPAGHPGFPYGAAHGASLQSQIMIFRSVGYPVNTRAIVAGFSRGIATDTADAAPRARLDALMTPVNSLIIRRKLLSHFN